MTDSPPSSAPPSEIDIALADMPREVRNVINPVRLSQSDTLCFRCYPGISCFNACCSNIEIVLSPYDILRLRRRLGLDADEFLYTYAEPNLTQKGQLPIALMRMDEESGKCPFNTPEGCSVYEDRPITCRYYPVGMALMHHAASQGEEEFFFLIKESFCKGHEENKTQTIAEWRKDQGVEHYDEMNRSWMECILKRRSAGDTTGTSLPLSEMFYMAYTNPEEFRRFVFNSSFLKRYHVDPDVEAKIRTDDVALTNFAFDWLKSVLFGDQVVNPREEAVAELRMRRRMEKNSPETAQASGTAADESRGEHENTSERVADQE